MVTAINLPDISEEERSPLSEKPGAWDEVNGGGNLDLSTHAVKIYVV